jgi:Transposase Tn5 dimerisation domain
VAAQTPLGRLKIPVPRSADGPAWQVTLTVRSAPLEWKPPDRVGRKWPRGTVNAVGIRAQSPRAGVKPRDWLVLTRLPVATLEAASPVVEDSSGGWPIQVFLRISQRGCGIEQIPLKSEDRLLQCLARYRIVAWRVPWLRRLGRTCPDLACDMVLAEEQWRWVWTIVGPEPAPTTAPLNTKIGLVARLGGHLGRKPDGPPGAQGLGIGIPPMRDFALAWPVFGPRPAKE